MLHAQLFQIFIGGLRPSGPDVFIPFHDGCHSFVVLPLFSAQPGRQNVIENCYSILPVTPGVGVVRRAT